MKYARVHTHNGVTREAGTPYDGDMDTARLLHRKGVLVPDGSPGDDLVTAASARQQWDANTDAPQKE